MTKRSGLGGRFLVDGINLSGDTGAIDRCSGGPAALEVTGIDKSAFERLGGKRDGGIDWTAWFNDSAGAAHLTLRPLPTTDRVVSYLVGTALGDPAASCVAKQISYDPSRGEDGALSFSVQSQANGFGVEWGELLTAGIRTDTAATNGTALDAGAATAFGFQAYLHMLSVTGTSCTVKLQESSDNGGGDAFADVVGGGFTAVTPGAAPQAQRIAATPANLERYVRVVTTGTFSNAQFVVVLVRNLTLTGF